MFDFFFFCYVFSLKFVMLFFLRRILKGKVGYIISFVGEFKVDF